jgi:hypothetical protein
MCSDRAWFAAIRTFTTVLAQRLAIIVRPFMTRFDVTA